MHLRDWRVAKGVTQQVLAESLDPPVSQYLVSLWENGKSRITLHYAFQIESLTKKKVTPQDCFSMYQGDKK